MWFVTRVGTLERVQADEVLLCLIDEGHRNGSG